jgi:hypothetical protein
MKKLTTFKTTDGCTFETEEEAIDHEALTALKQNYERSRYEYLQALAKREKTLDGYDFQGIYHTYFYIQRFVGMPHLVEFRFAQEWEFDIDDTDKIIICQRRTNGDGGYTTMRIEDLYYDRAAGQRELVQKQMAFLQEEAKRLGMKLVEGI